MSKPKRKRCYVGEGKYALIPRDKVVKPDVVLLQTVAPYIGRIIGVEVICPFCGQHHQHGLSRGWEQPHCYPSERYYIDMPISFQGLTIREVGPILNAKALESVMQELASTLRWKRPDITCRKCANLNWEADRKRDCKVVKGRHAANDPICVAFAPRTGESK